jgi:TolA-binding protein
MRFHLIAMVLLAGTASPALAQRADDVERRVDRLESEMRAVQRRVFPGGRAQFVEPEIRPPSGTPDRPAASGDALASLAARVDALETQLRSLTGQVEEQGYRTRQLEEQINRLRNDLQGRIDRIEQASAPSAPAPAPAPPRPTADEPAQPTEETAAAETPPAPVDEAEAAYNAGYRLWNAGNHGEAQRALGAAAERFPNSPWTSWMRNLEGRAYLDDDKPATAARVFLANYQNNPRGARAADSLYFLGQALTRLNRRPEACRVYAELASVYPEMRDFLRQRLPQARADAGCEE